MGVEFHITRAEFWAENEDAQITADEWLNYINNDNELSRYIINGDYHALWSCKYTRFSSTHFLRFRFFDLLPNSAPG